MPKLLVTLLWLSFQFANGQQKANATLYFEFANAKLTDASADSLRSLVNKLGKQPPSKIIINGYADNSGTAGYNTALSQERADSIALLLRNALPKNVEILVNSFGSNDLKSEKEEEQSLNRRTEIFIQYPEVEKPITALDAFNEDVAEQHFIINLDDTVYIKAKEGTIIKIVPQSIQNKSGQLVKGNAEMIIKEYYTPDQIILAGLHSNSDKGLLQTGGMVFMTIIQAGDTMKAETKKPVEITMPRIQPELSDMNVFELHENATGHKDHSGDSTHAGWNNTGRSFNPYGNFWAWESSRALSDLLIEDYNILFTNMKVGRTFSDEYNLYNPIINLSGERDWRRYSSGRHISKSIEYSITKIDSATIKLHTKIKFRARGKRITGKKYLDTTFLAYYTAPVYEAAINNISWVNCDRFYDYKDKMNLYVTLDGYSGANVILYFKTIHAYMPAYFTGRGYQAKKIPSGLPVVVIAMGKKDGEYYLGKKEVITKHNISPSVALSKSNKEELQKVLKQL